jgi:hypothetical protein
MRKDSTIVIGDVHGSDYWKKVIKENPDCRYVFWGEIRIASTNPYLRALSPGWRENANDRKYRFL